jgi:hypothetical protein
MAVITEEAWAVPGPGKQPDPDRTRKSEYTPFTLKHVYDTSDVEKATVDKFNKTFKLKPAPYKPQKPE